MRLGSHPSHCPHFMKRSAIPENPHATLTDQCTILGPHSVSPPSTRIMARHSEPPLPRTSAEEALHSQEETQLHSGFSQAHWLLRPCPGSPPGQGCTSKFSSELKQGEVTQRLGPGFTPSDHQVFSLLSSVSRDHTHGSSTWALTLVVQALWVYGEQTLM